MLKRKSASVWEGDFNGFVKLIGKIAKGEV